MRWTVAMALGIAVGVSAVGMGTHYGVGADAGDAGMQPAAGANQRATVSCPCATTRRKKAPRLRLPKSAMSIARNCARWSRAFSAAEEKAALFLEKNKGWCGVPDQAISSAKDMHAKTVKFREMVCAPAPQPHVPTLSDAMGAPALDTAKNTKTGAGTFDTLTGNPLAK